MSHIVLLASTIGVYHGALIKLTWATITTLNQIFVRTFNLSIHHGKQEDNNYETDESDSEESAMEEMCASMDNLHRNQTFKMRFSISNNASGRLNL